jgi:hypothetical protein
MSTNIHDPEHGSFKVIAEDLTHRKGVVSNAARIEPALSEKKPSPMCMKAFCVGSLGFFMVVFILGLSGASVAYYVFSIMGLVQDSHDSIQDTCNKSNLWPFLLTVLVINLGGAKASSSGNKDTGADICNMFLGIIILISMCTWGSLEFWNECVQDKLSDTLIFLMVKITIITQYIVIGILVIGILILWKKLWTDAKNK